MFDKRFLMINLLVLLLFGCQNRNSVPVKIHMNFNTGEKVPILIKVNNKIVTVKAKQAEIVTAKSGRISIGLTAPGYENKNIVITKGQILNKTNYVLNVKLKKETAKQ